MSAASAGKSPSVSPNGTIWTASFLAFVSDVYRRRAAELLNRGAAPRERGESL